MSGGESADWGEWRTNLEPLNKFEVVDVKIVHDPLTFAPHAVAQVKMYIHPELEIQTHALCLQRVHQALEEKIK